jgi:hypothetical protein
VLPRIFDLAAQSARKERTGQAGTSLPAVDLCLHFALSSFPSIAESFSPLLPWTRGRFYLENEHRNLLRVRHRFFNSNYPNAGDWLAILRCIFFNDISVIVAWQRDAAGDQHVIMHLIPKNKGEWLKLFPTLFGCIAVAWIVWKFWTYNISEKYNPFTPPPELVSILNHATFLAAVVFDGLVLCYALNARRHQKMRALTFWIWGSSINLIREIGLVLCNYWTPPLGNIGSNFGRTDFWGLFYSFPSSSFMEIYWLGYLLAGVLYVAGVILIIQEQRAKEQFRPSPNTAMFVALGVLVSMILMGISFMRLEHAELLPALAINAVVAYFCFVGYRLFKAKAFVCLVLAAILPVARIIVVYLLDQYHNRIHNGGISTTEQWLLGLMLLGSIMAIIFWGVGIIYIIQHICLRRT